jgi:hypothetical protein
MTYLKKQRSITERRATLDTFATGNARLFINGILVERMLNKPALKRSCWAKVVLSTSIQRVWLRFKVTGAKLTVSTYLKFVDDFDGRDFQYAVIHTFLTCYTLVRIKLPDSSIRLAAAQR